MPLDALDVNVHPTKAEVRFREQSLMHQVIRRAVGDALGQGPAPTLSLTPTASPSAYPVGETLPIPGRARRRTVPEPMAARIRPQASGLRPARGTGRHCTGHSARRTGHPAPGTRHRTQHRALGTQHLSDPPRPVPRHLHHRGRSRGRGDHRPARRARARALRADAREADERAAGEPAAAHADPRGPAGVRPTGAGRARGGSRAARFRGRGVRRRGGEGVGAAGAAWRGRGRRDAAHAGRRPRRLRSRQPGRGRAEADGRHHRVPRGGEGQLPADLREDGPHPRGARRDGLLDHLPARPAR